MTDSTPKDPKKPAAPSGDGASPLEDLVEDVVASELGTEAKPQPAPTPKPTAPRKATAPPKAAAVPKPAAVPSVPTPPKPKPEPAPVDEDEQAPIVLDMEDEPFVFDKVEAAPTLPEAPPAAAPEPPGPKPAAPPPAVIIDDPSLVASAPSAAAAAAKPAAGGAPKGRPDYTSDLPSIVPSGVRERFTPPAATTAAPPAPSLASIARSKPVARRTGLAVPRMAILGVLTAALAGGAFWLYGRTKAGAPVITSVIPPKVEPGQTVTVTGTGFDSDAAGNTVSFGEQTGKVTAASDTQLAVTAPASLALAEIPLRVKTRSGRSNALFVKVYRGPRVASVDPPVALPGSEVVLRGEQLDGPGLTVQVGGLPATVKESSRGMTRVLVPDLPMLEGRSVPISVQVAGETGRPADLILGRLPLVTKVTPQSGPPGTAVTVRGHGFDPDVRGDQLTIGGERALLLSATANEIAAIIPAPVASGNQVQAPVVVQARGASSSGGIAFVVVSPSESVFRPYYFPAAVVERPGEDVVFVSTALGPALLLAGKADAPSTVERAMRAAAALNAVVQAAASKPAVLEARDRPAAGVALQGSPSLLVAATAEDAAAYGREPSARGQRASPHGLAELWAALLQDHLTLFVQRQRPLRMVEMSPRARTFVDLFAEAERRSGTGAGVPVNLLRPLTPSLARSFRDMALILPSGPSTVAAAVAGRWEGTMQEAAAAPRRITVTLRLDGTRLLGSLTTRSRAVAMDVPLKDVTYEKGRLGFVFESGTTAHRWSGVVDGASVEGTILEGSTEVGHFSLRYAE